MKRLLLTPIIVIGLAGCATTSGPKVDNAATRTGQNLVGALATVFQDYADVKENGVSSLWSISKGLNAYNQVVKGTADIKQLVADWKATKGDGNLLTRLGEVLNNADVSPQTKALATAKAAEMVAANKGP